MTISAATLYLSTTAGCVGRAGGGSVRGGRGVLFARSRLQFHFRVSRGSRKERLMVVTDASKKNRPRAWEPYVCQGVLGVVLVVAAVVRHREFAVFFGGGERCLDQPAVNGGERSVPPRGARSFCTIVSSPRETERVEKGRNRSGPGTCPRARSLRFFRARPAARF